MPRLLSVKRTPGGTKEFVAVFEQDNGRKKTTRFGTASNYVTNSAKTKADRTNYIARHIVNEDHGAPMSAGALSRFVLWGGSRSLSRNVSAYKKRFNL